VSLYENDVSANMHLSSCSMSNLKDVRLLEVPFRWKGWKSLVRGIATRPY